jgi:hypothetical protein
MATYYGTYGQKVQYLASDPSDPQIGQVWYNSTSAILKVRQVTTTGTWASGGNVNTARRVMGQAGLQTASIIFGGFVPPNTAATESYNGTSWTNVPATLSSPRVNLSGAGTATAALAIGGNPGNITTTQLYNGSTWTTNPTGLNTGRSELGAVGIQTAALAFGGSGGPSASESWNGSTWTSTPSLNTGRYGISGAGTQTAALGFMGYVPPMSAATESFNGSSWTSVNSMNTARSSGGGAGTQTKCIAFGGESPTTTATEEWNGTSWATSPGSLTTARVKMGFGPNGTYSDAICCSGEGSGGNVANTEEWTGAGVGLTKTVTVS